jgi:hypothetical protein
MQMTNPDEILAGYVDKPSLALALKKSERTIDRWRGAPDGLPHTMIGATVLFRIESVRGWLARRERHRNPRRTTR